MNRPLTKEGILASQRVSQLFEKIEGTKCFSSPYHRSIETIKGIAQQAKQEIALIEDFRERKVSEA